MQTSTNSHAHHPPEVAEEAPEPRGECALHREPRGATVSRRAFLHGGVSIGAAVGGAMIARQALVDGTKAAPEGGPTSGPSWWTYDAVTAVSGVPRRAVDSL